MYRVLMRERNGHKLGSQSQMRDTEEFHHHHQSIGGTRAGWAKFSA